MDGGNMSAFYPAQECLAGDAHGLTDLDGRPEAFAIQEEEGSGKADS